MKLWIFQWLLIIWPCNSNELWIAFGIYFSFIWSRFKIRLSGILWSSTKDTILCKYKSWASFFAPSRISVLPVVFMQFLKPILWKRLFAQDDEPRSMWSNIKCGFLAIRALAMDTAITKVIKPPLLQRANKNFWTVWSKLPNKSGHPLGKTFRFGKKGHFSFLAFSSSALYMAQNPLTVLLLTGQRFDPNSSAAAAGPLMTAYFPIMKLSWLNHFGYGFHVSLFELETAETATSKSRAPRPDSSCKSCDGTMEENFMFQTSWKIAWTQRIFLNFKRKSKSNLLSINFLSRSLPATDVGNPWELLPWLLWHYLQICIETITWSLYELWSLSINTFEMFVYVMLHNWNYFTNFRIPFDIVSTILIFLIFQKEKKKQFQ